MAKTNGYTAEQIIEALRYAQGMTTLAAKRLGCSYNTIMRYVREYPTVAAVLVEEREKQLDQTELRLIKAVNRDDLTAIIFYLKTLGKRRGYVERTEQVNFNVDTALIQRAIDAIEKQGLSASDVFESLINAAAEETHRAVVGADGTSEGESAAT